MKKSGLPGTHPGVRRNIPALLLSLTAATCLALVAASAAEGNHRAAPPPKQLPAPVQVNTPIGIQIEQIATSAELGGTYGGQSTDPSGALTIYVTSQGRAALASALARAGIPASAYTLSTVGHSDAELVGLTARLARDRASLATQGIDMVKWGPDSVSNTVQILISDYTPQAAQTLETQYGGSGLISVAPAAPDDYMVRRTNRYYDVEPYFNGDRIFMDNNLNEQCTQGFAVTGNASGDKFNVTAGHCFGSTVNTNFNTRVGIGPIATNYFNTTSGDYDFETYHCDCLSPVWYEGPNHQGDGLTHSVVGWCYCDSGAVAVDGATTGEIANNSVTRHDICTVAGGVQTCHLNEVHNSNAQICLPTDSGGPVYQRTSNNGVFATGIIVASSTDFHTCDYQRWRGIEVQSNSTLKTQ